MPRWSPAPLGPPRGMRADRDRVLVGRRRTGYPDRPGRRLDALRPWHRPCQSLESVANSAVADTTLNGTLVDKWFVVEDAEDGLIVDLHLNERAAARGFTTTSPARLVIDLRATGDDQSIAPPTSGGGIVLLSPQAGVGLYPLQVTGYSAPGIDAVRIQLADAAGVGVDRSISTRSSAHVWHAFTSWSATDPPAPSTSASEPLEKKANQSSRSRSRWIFRS